MKLSDMFSEENEAQREAHRRKKEQWQARRAARSGWGWRARGEAPPETPKKPQPSEEELQRIHNKRLKEKVLKQKQRSWMAKTDVGEELMQKQRLQKQRQKSPPKFFPED